MFLLEGLWKVVKLSFPVDLVPRFQFGLLQMDENCSKNHAASDKGE